LNVISLPPTSIETLHQSNCQKVLHSLEKDTSYFLSF